MKFERVKKPEHIVLTGITVETDQTGDTYNSYTLSDEEGNVVRFRMENYNLYVEVPAKPKTVTRYRVTGSIAGAVMQPEDFEYDYLAQDRVNTIRRECGTCEVGYTSVEVVVQE